MTSKTQGEALAKERKAMMAVSKDLKGLEGLTLNQLRERHLALYGTEARTKNKIFLKKKLAWRIQELAEGELSDQAKARLEELMPAELPTRAVPKTRKKAEVSASPTPTRDSRLPEAGTTLRREHDGAVHEIQILEEGFRYRGKVHTSLSGIARLITGTAWNGYVFFGLARRGEKA